MTKKNILLIRHAESTANAGLPTPRAHSVPLSPKGLDQAKKLADDFPMVPELIIMSSFSRTHDTAAPLISKMSGAKVEIWDMIHEFTYLNRETQKNKTMAERRPFALEYWNRRDPFYTDGPEEESFFNLLERIETFLGKIEEREERAIAVFSHGQFLNALKIVKGLKTPVKQLTKDELARLMDRLMELQEKTPIPNAGILNFHDFTD